MCAIETIRRSSSLHNLKKEGVTFLFTDRHASLADARFSADLADLNRVDWDILQRRDFSRDNDDLAKTSRYQAEALVHRGMATDALLGIACYNEEQKANAETLIEKRELTLRVVSKREWYF
jgi:ssDNA thymidine ADP-ribosyltransferase, DarT